MTSWWTEASASRVDGNIGRTAGAEAIANRKRVQECPLLTPPIATPERTVWSRAISYAQRVVAQEGDIQLNRDADPPPVNKTGLLRY
jgi:hypothetical protein